MRPTFLKSIYRPLLAAIPLSALAGCCPPGSNQIGPQWTVSVPAAALGLVPDGGAADGGPISMDGGGMDAMFSPYVDYCTFCDPDKNCPGCVSQRAYLEQCGPPRADKNGMYLIDCATIVNQCIGGRRPAGLLAGEVAMAPGEAGRYFAELARLEAASVPAFVRMHRELRALCVPRPLLRAAALAARDEVRHARLCGILAFRYGARPLRPRIQAQGPRTVEQIAIENEAEGCVRETYAALLAHHQARASRDPVVRAAMQTIARDETRHAALSWTVAGFLADRLTRAARLRVRAARDQAVMDLRAEAEVSPSEALQQAAGLPDAKAASALIEGLGTTLWAA